MSMMLLNIKNYAFLISTLFLLSACGGSKQDEIEEMNDEATTTTLDSQKISAQNVFNALPGRNEIINLTTKAQAEYNATVLNDPNNVKNYTIESSKALNLGVYGSDLNVTGVFEQTQESMLFLSCVNSLAKSLGVSNAFDEKMVNRMEANKENRDSTMEIISQSFKNADSYLKANGRPGTSSLIVAGAWIEGIYTACMTAKETKSEAIVKQIFSEKESLKYLIELLQSYKLTEDVNYITTDLKAIQSLCEAKSDANYSLDALKELDLKITALRTKVISSK
jgi:phage anti-repressor protein